MLGGDGFPGAGAVRWRMYVLGTDIAVSECRARENPLIRRGLDSGFPPDGCRMYRNPHPHTISI